MSEDALAQVIITASGDRSVSGSSLLSGRPFWVRFSLPFRPGELLPENFIRLKAPERPAVTVQTRALACWDDGSVRWLDCQAIVDSTGIHRVERSADLSESPGHPVTVKATADRIKLSNGIMSICLSREGAGPVESVLCNGRPLCAEDVAAVEAIVHDNDGTRYDTANETGRTLDLVAGGPVRAVADVCGEHRSTDGGRCMSYRLRAEVTAGQPTVVLRYMFTHDDPGGDYHHLNSIELLTRWAAATPLQHHVHQRHYGLLGVSREVETDMPVAIEVNGRDHAVAAVANPECLRDDTDYPEFAQMIHYATEPFVGVSLQNGFAAVHVEDFVELAPKGLRADGGEIALDIWPASHGTLGLHQGWSRQLTLNIACLDAAPSAASVRSAVDAVTDTGKAVLAPQAYEAANCWMAPSLFPKSPRSPRRFDRYLTDLSSLTTVIGMWDLGDTIDPGYSLTYAPLGRLCRHETGTPARFNASGHHPVTTPGQFEPVWTNNEYDVILCFGREILRGGATPDLWRRLRHFARHAIEVDFISYSDHPQLHHGSPAHSAKHCHASSYPSHLWDEGLLLYYCLSGDDDALDVAVKTGDSILATFADEDRRKRLWKFTREIGWALMHLSFLADITRESRFLDMATEMADDMLTVDLTPELIETMTLYSFGYSSIAMGMEALHVVTPRDDIAEWLVDVSNRVGTCVLAGTTGAESTMLLNYFNAAWAVSEDPAHIRYGMRVLEQLLDTRNWYDPVMATKPVALLYRGLSRFLRPAHELGLLAEFNYRF